MPADKDPTYNMQLLFDGVETQIVRVKQHKSRTSKDEYPTILLWNVPSYFTKDCLLEVFSKYGKIIELIEQEKPGIIQKPIEENLFNVEQVNRIRERPHTVYIRFETMGAVDRSLKFVKSGEKIDIGKLNARPLLGIAKMCMDYINSVPPLSKLKAEINSFMQAYDKQQEEEEKKKAEQEGVPDEEGWIQVTNGSRRTENNEDRLLNSKKKRKRAEKRKRENNDLLAYDFQKKEQKKKRIVELQKKFKEDKERILKMRAQRKFRPL